MIDSGDVYESLPLVQYITKPRKVKEEKAMHSFCAHGRAVLNYF